MNVSIDNKKVDDMELIRDFRVGDRDLWIVKYILFHEYTSIYSCINERTRIVSAKVFIGRSEKAISYLDSVTNIGSISTNLLLMLRNATFVDISTNRTLIIPKLGIIKVMNALVKARLSNAMSLVALGHSFFINLASFIQCILSRLDL